MVTDEQYRELYDEIKELKRDFKKMSVAIADISMRLDCSRAQKSAEQIQFQKDVTRYLFNGKQLNKRQLVLECIKRYIKDSGITDPAVLLELFPDHIQGSLGVLRPVEEAERYSSAKERFFFKDDEIIHFNQKTLVVSKDWTAKNIGRFISVMNSLGYEIKPMNRN